MSAVLHAGCSHSFRAAAPSCSHALRAQQRASCATQAIARPVAFPRDYNELIQQCKDSLLAAHADGVMLQEVQFPVAGLDSVSGDQEGNAETNRTVLYLRELLDAYKRDGSQAATRVFFPDTVELALARGGAAASSDGVPAPDTAFQKGAFADYPGPCTHVFEPNFLTISGLARLMNQHPLIERRTEPTDARFVIAYPSQNLDELIEVAELHERVARPGSKPIVVVMGEMERIRSGYYPSWWARSEMAKLLAFTPQFTQVYYIHNFKGANAAVLFRAYPGPFQVLLNTGEGGFVTLWTGNTFPGHRKVAVDILPAALAERRAKDAARKR